MGPLCDLCAMPCHPHELRQWGKLRACDACIEQEAEREARERARKEELAGRDVRALLREAMP